VENIGPLDSPEFKAFIKKYSSFLAELRRRIIFTLIFFLAAMFGGFVFYEQIIKFLIDILSLEGVNIVFTSPFQFINLAITCGVATGIVLSLPLLVIQILYFLKPALQRKEFKLVVRFLPFCFLLFITGFIFGAYIMKWQIEIFLTRSISIGIGNVLDVSNLLTTVVMTSVFMGVGFQFPIVLLLLLRLGIIKPKHLSRQRRWIYLGSFLFAILLPPDSILADVVLAMPLIVLFELTLMINRVYAKK